MHLGKFTHRDHGSQKAISPDCRGRIVVSGSYQVAKAPVSHHKECPGGINAQPENRTFLKIKDWNTRNVVERLRLIESGYIVSEQKRHKPKI